MTTAAQTTSRPTHFDAGCGFTAVATLAGEHALLMRDVLRRTTPVLALLDIRSWPHAELGTLTVFLRSAVLRQASDEEVLLFPHDATAAPFAELSADHVRLHTLTNKLERIHSAPCPPHELRALIGELLTTLQRHLRDEQAVLAALPEISAAAPSAAAVFAGENPWPSDDGPVLISLDAMPGEHAVELCVERLLRLNPGQRARIRAVDGAKLTQVCLWLHAFDSALFGTAHEANGRQHSLQITRRLAG